jgi:hypothetical protein
LLSPKTIADVRSQRNMVILEFGKKGADRTLVRFTHLGWGEGASWDEACDSFDHAESEALLPSFRHAMELGPVKWEKTPKLPPLVSTLRASVTRR